MKSIQLKAMGKINLGLDILRKREDGYHDVKMVMQMVTLYDRITMTKTKKKDIKVVANLPFLPVNEKNIVYKAAKLLIDEFHLEEGVCIELEKHIPVAAGMAGGSSDGATVLHGMNKLFDLNLTKQELMERGLKLGADVPFCVLRRTALSEGIGEVLTTVKSLPNCYILIAKPPISVSTKYVYDHLDLANIDKHPDIDGVVNALNERDLSGVVNRLENVLETVTIKKYPIIEEIKQQMKTFGALNAVMSGSGPTVFGIFDDEKQARKAFLEMKKSHLAKQVFLTRPFIQRGKTNEKFHDEY